MDEPLLEYLDIRNPRYTVLVVSYAYGQFRIQVTDKEVPDFHARSGHGAIVREL